jgi:hypothetical protein
MKSVTIRIEEPLLEEIDYLAKTNKSDRATEIRKILQTGLLKSKLELAVWLYREGNSLEKAAEEARVNLWDLIEYIKEIGQTKIANIKELEKELREKLL